MVQPNHAFFGEKDFQQLQVIRAMVQDLSMNLKIHGVPTVREEDGLAMSSRNGYLTDAERTIAPKLYASLYTLSEQIISGRRDFKQLIKEHSLFLNNAGFKTDYIEIRCADTLMQPGHEDAELVILAAAFLGKTRLIDNLPVALG